jgi:hypothetical protein
VLVRTSQNIAAMSDFRKLSVEMIVAVMIPVMLTTLKIP